MWAALVAAISAAMGYLANQLAQRHERRSKSHAEARRAVRRVQEVPSWIWRRADTSPQTVERLGLLQSEAWSEVRFDQQWISIESRSVGESTRISHAETRARLEK